MFLPVLTQTSACILVNDVEFDIVLCPLFSEDKKPVKNIRKFLMSSRDQISNSDRKAEVKPTILIVFDSFEETQYRCNLFVNNEKNMNIIIQMFETIFHGFKNLFNKITVLLLIYLDICSCITTKTFQTSIC